MTGLVRKASILVALGMLLTAAAALAGIPDPAHCTLPAYIDLYACKTTAPLPPTPWDTLSVIGNGYCISTFNPGVGNGCLNNHLVIRDVGGNPVPGCDVKLIFCSDFKLYTPYPDPRGVVDCTDPNANSVTAISGPDGEVHVAILGAGKNGLPRASSGRLCATGCGCVRIFACNVEITTGNGVPASAYDENGVVAAKGVESTDNAAWLWDFGRLAAQRSCRSDFSHAATGDPDVTSIDQARWLKVFGLGKSANSCGTLCP